MKDIPPDVLKEAFTRLPEPEAATITECTVPVLKSYFAGGHRMFMVFFERRDTPDGKRWVHLPEQSFERL